MNTTTLDPTAILADTTRHRLVLEAILKPVIGDLFQPAGFPEIGHVIYKAPRPGNASQEVCIVDSAASMANHLETVMHSNPLTHILHPDLAGLPYIECTTDEGWPKVTKVGPHRSVITSLSEGHRIASSIFTGKEAVHVVDAKPTAQKFGDKLKEDFGMPDLGNRTHPQPEDWWNVFKTIYAYDPNSLVHGLLFPALGIKIPRLLTAHHEAFGATRVETSGVKFDKLAATTSGQPIFTRDEETAVEIRATFVIDLSQLRSFGHDGKGLSDSQKTFLLRLALWKIGKLVASPFRYRSGCDLELVKLTEGRGETKATIDPASLCAINADAIKTAAFRSGDDKRPVVTQVYWKAGELFKEGKADALEPTEGDDAATDGQ